MSVPQNLKYASSHEWCLSNDDGSYSIGITHHAQDALGDIVFIELPKLGQQVSSKGACAVVESVKAASDIYAPISGEIIAINDSLKDAPELINSSPYESWFFKIKPSNLPELDLLLDAQAYQSSIGE
jgi:glycine cleavage system H protein